MIYPFKCSCGKRLSLLDAHYIEWRWYCSHDCYVKYSFTNALRVFPIE